MQILLARGHAIPGLLESAYEGAPHSNCQIEGSPLSDKRRLSPHLPRPESASVVLGALVPAAIGM
jgi:hypothetical protein